MASSSSKGNYYKRKTKLWFEKQGYTVQLTEFTSMRPIGGGKVIWTKKDVFGADGISMNGVDIIFWNSKATTEERKSGVSKHKSEAKLEFTKYPFPPYVKRQAIIWKTRVKQPTVVEFST